MFIFNVRYAMEIHVVFYNTRFESFDEALVSPVGLCVIGMIGKVIYMNIIFYIYI